MRLLVLTQKVDKEDPILGFFHNWLFQLSRKFEKITVICLEKGSFDLPKNITVFSLGKESGKNKLKYFKNFFNLILGLHGRYDSVFVHMNQEYVLLGGIFWKILRKKIYLWRNHQMGNLFTMIAVWISDKVFCTSKYAFVARYKKTEIMPVGIDIEKFKDLKIERSKNTILFLGRISPIKNPELLVKALDILNKNRIDFICNFYGDPVPGGEFYLESLKNLVSNCKLENKIIFHNSTPNYKTPEVYNKHEIFINLTPPGSFDKTILEAAICGCIPIIVNKSLAEDIDREMIASNDAEDIARKISYWLGKSDEDKKITSLKLQKYVSEKHSLDILIESFFNYLK